MSRRWAILFLVILSVLFLLFMFTGVFRNSGRQQKIITKNKDTGQTIITDPGVTPETGGNQVFVVLGADKLINSGFTQTQLTFAEQLINTGVDSLSSKKYTQVAILNKGYKGAGNQITAKLRLGESSTLVDLGITYHDLTYVRVTITDPSTHKTYDSGDQQPPLDGY